MNNEIYVEYVNTHESEIAKYINECFVSSREFIKVKLIREIRKYLTPVPVHYIWKWDGTPYDYSGELVKKGVVSLNQTIQDFLENEYSGNKEATYVSGYGFHYNTYGDELHYFTIELASEIMFPAIRRYVENHFQISLSDNDFEEIRDNCDGFDRIYDDCLASDFFSYEPVVEFTQIGTLLLREIYKSKEQQYSK